ncbi:phosphatidylinositol-specific phospholipase C [Bacillus thuringiensis]|uniref:phosphatidylinositol-specific phospholipase C n=1 Tax=Bacillus thuringiensis TaxID=1428 RepID=UPI000BECC449|nr:phosphatidylinositol-specific phospholipase C [Bacillus thuringiensis]PEE68562.1 1-phosphatidylinositol phosphodiesterase [Bacillus thuringiensis]
MLVMNNTNLNTQETNVISEKQSINFSKWMSKIPDSKTLAQISIPGTHDSGAFKSGVIVWAKTQDQNFHQQLNHGVRFFDIRGRVTDDDTIVLHHGPIYLKVTLRQFINDAKDFLKSNPSETIIMSLKEEYEPMEGATYSFSETFEKYYFGDSIFLKKGGNITLGDARGKIVLFRRFFGGKMTGGYSSMSWPDNRTFTSTTNDNIKVSVQDEYSVGRKRKKEAIANLLMEASRSHSLSNHIHINFTSLSADFNSPHYYATEMNPFAATDVRFYNVLYPSKVGWVIMDYVSDEWSPLLYEQVVCANFEYWPTTRKHLFFEKEDTKGKDLTDVPFSQWNDKVSSIVLKPYTKMMIYEHSNQTGDKKLLENNSNLRKLFNLSKEGFDNKMSAWRYM